MEKTAFIHSQLQQELAHRNQMARELMGKMGLDAILLFTGPNLFYLTGMPCGRSGSRPYVYLLPRFGAPVLIVHAGRQFEAKRFTGIQDIRIYTQLSHLPLDPLFSSLRERNLLRGRIGLEMGEELVLDLPITETRVLTSTVAQAEFVDASLLLWKMRMIKSPYEINQITKACEITSMAYARTFQMTKAGLRESEVEALMYRNMLEAGGSAPWVLITSGNGNYDLVSKGGTSRTIEPGDMVWMDVGCAVNGYWSDFSRACVIDRARAEQLEAHRIVYEITQLGVGMVRHGVPVAEIGHKLNTAVKELNLPITSNISGLASRVGHGLGLVVTELPSLNEDDSTLLEPGMIVTIEPGIATEFGTFHIEQNVLVTPNDPQVLSTADWQLTRAGVMP
jgi:Xaa-Pro dipeptidase